MPRKILIDTDPGVDDAFAILAALRAPELEVVGLTTVFGNTDVDTCALNGLRLVELEGNDYIPVAKGCSQALIIPTEELGTHVHGFDGMGNTHPPRPYGKLDNRHAAEFIIDTVKAHPGEITLVPLGPLTNIGLALRLEPKIASLVKEVVLMGGNAYVPGNISPVAEANVYHDPHAAEIVFSANWPITMVGLDVTTKTRMTPAYLERLYAAGNPAVRLLERIHPCYKAYFDKHYNMQGTIHTHDPSTIAYLLAPQFYTVEKVAVHVQTEGKCAGQTVPDKHHQWGDRPPVNVLVDVDEPAVLQLLFDLLTK
jgi:inosine-uridine nucleoside N-ribohydrolase